MKSVLEELFNRERVGLGSVDYIFCDDQYLLQINQQFLQHDDYTDIITFDLTDPVGGARGGSGTKHVRSTPTPKQGEIYISIERVIENAIQLGLPREEELRRVMFHGCLHLCGYKDKLNEQQVLMRKKEDEYLRLYKKRST